MTSVDLLRSVVLFRQLREADLNLLGGVMHSRDFGRKRVILSAHDPCDAFYVLVAGQVKVMLVAEDGREVILSLVRTGDFFGERALLDNEPHAASVISTEASTMLVLHRDDFRRAVLEVPGVAIGLVRALLGRLREADHRIGGLILLDVHGRVSQLLLQLADWGDGATIATLPTHQVIAQMVGASRETVSRTFKTLTDERAITLGRGGCTITNRHALEAAAGQWLRTQATTIAPQQRRLVPTLRPAP